VHKPTLGPCGCGRSRGLPARVDEPGGLHQMRAVSADGVVLALRSHDNPRQGTLEFWSEAVKNELVGFRGYKLAGKEAIQSQAGRPGKLLSFATEQKGTMFTYMLAVFVPGRQVLIAEAGGKAQAVQPKAEALKKAMLSVK